MAHQVTVNDTADTSSVADQSWLLLQPLWDLVLANSYYTSSPLFLVVVANGFYFVCMVPYIILDFYGLDHWDWVKRYVFALHCTPLRHKLEYTIERIQRICFCNSAFVSVNEWSKT